MLMTIRRRRHKEHLKIMSGDLMLISQRCRLHKKCFVYTLLLTSLVIYMRIITYTIVVGKNTKYKHVWIYENRVTFNITILIFTKNINRLSQSINHRQSVIACLPSLIMCGCLNAGPWAYKTRRLRLSYKGNDQRYWQKYHLSVTRPTLPSSTLSGLKPLGSVWYQLFSRARYCLPQPSLKGTYLSLPQIWQVFHKSWYT